MVPTPMTGWSLLSSRSDWLLKSSRPVLPAWHWLIQRKSVLSAEQQTRSLSIILNSDLWYIYQPEKSLSAKTLVTKTKNFSTLLLLLMYSFMFIYNWGETCLQCRRPRFNPWVRKIPWRRERLPIPVFSSGESHGQRNLACYSPWGHKHSLYSSPDPSLQVIEKPTKAALSKRTGGFT